MQEHEETEAEPKNSNALAGTYRIYGRRKVYGESWYRAAMEMELGTGG